MTSRLKRIGFSTAAGIGIFAGAAGLTAAASGPNDPTPSPPGVEAPSTEVEAPGDAGIDCENGIDTATGAECDGGPAAAQAEEATETPSVEDDSGVESDESVSEGDQPDDGIDHQFEGEETGENGNGIPDADDLNGTEANTAG